MIVEVKFQPHSYENNFQIGHENKGEQDLAKYRTVTWAAENQSLDEKLS